MRIAAVKLLQRHLVVVGNGVAKLCTRLRYLGQSRLHLHDVLHLLLGDRLLEAEQLEHPDDVLLVGLADFGRSLVVLQIVVLLAEGQAALVDVENVLGSVLLVGSDVGSEELHVAVGRQLHLNVEELLLGLGSLQAVDDGHERSQAVLLPAGRVHRQFVQVAQLLFDGTLLVAVFPAAPSGCR